MRVCAPYVVLWKQQGALGDLPDIENLLPACRRSSACRVPGRDSAEWLRLWSFRLEKDQTSFAVFEAKWQSSVTFLLVYLFKICLKMNLNYKDFWVCVAIWPWHAVMSGGNVLLGGGTGQSGCLACQHPSHTGCGTRAMHPPGPGESWEGLVVMVMGTSNPWCPGVCLGWFFLCELSTLNSSL